MIPITKQNMIELQRAVMVRDNLYKDCRDKDEKIKTLVNENDLYKIKVAQLRKVIMEEMK